ncbi:hypothetical protein Pan54_18910 [Rubinisphaera italica]|uniref:Uncharacterized protein n=1 Tax=Rubinisphaera italica TaxID=2527969 RepID=A0A5C5XDH7_9PLAN|nr:hypothetical protein Pan54_18910 [Rubinisphaera italica]
MHKHIQEILKFPLFSLKFFEFRNQSSQICPVEPFIRFSCAKSKLTEIEVENRKQLSNH